MHAPTQRKKYKEDLEHQLTDNAPLMFMHQRLPSQSWSYKRFAGLLVLAVLGLALLSAASLFFTATASAAAAANGIDSEPISDADLLALKLNTNHAARVPIVYTDTYNIGFFGMEKLHPFDSKKYERTFKSLTQERKLLLAREAHSPIEAPPGVLRLVHSSAYLHSLEEPSAVASIMEVPPVALLPNAVVQLKALRPMRHAVAGTMLAADLALGGVQTNAASKAAVTSAGSAEASTEDVRPGWGINLSGGYHHCSARSGGGFCAYADISIAVLYAAKKHGVSRVMIVDLDAHQGNGHENDKRNGVFTREVSSVDVDVFILDMFNSDIYPNDQPAQEAIDCPVRLQSGVGDEEYLALLRQHLDASLAKFQAQLVIYNAGTDCLAGDTLGLMDLSAEGIAERDNIVFSRCMEKNIPVAMLLSGGYQQTNAAVIASSIASLHSSLQLWTLDPSLLSSA